MIKALQGRILRNKFRKGFPIGDVEYDLQKIQEEIKEFTEAYREGNKAKMGEELADILILVLGLASYSALNMQTEILRKLRKIEKRIITKVDEHHFEKEEG